VGYRNHQCLIDKEVGDRGEVSVKASKAWSFPRGGCGTV
jgi:hypothetical protein